MTAYSDLSAVPAKRYGLILADPAWRFRTYGPQEGQRSRRDAERYYPTMTLEEMAALNVSRVAAPNCFLVMWTSWPHLPAAMALIAAWRFRYVSSMFVWVKIKRSFPHTRAFITNPDDFHCGTGYSSRKNVEIAILAKRGSPRRMAKDVRELIVSPVREHSRKPEQQYERLERFAAGPYLEMNARAARPNWDQWGNQIETFLQPPAPEPLALEKAPVQIGLFDPRHPRFTIAPGADDASDDANVVPMFRRAAP